MIRTPVEQAQPAALVAPMFDVLSSGHTCSVIPNAEERGRGDGPGRCRPPQVGGGTVRPCPCVRERQTLMERDDLHGDAFCHAYAEAGRRVADRICSTGPPAATPEG